MQIDHEKKIDRRLTRNFIIYSKLDEKVLKTSRKEITNVSTIFLKFKFTD